HPSPPPQAGEGVVRCRSSFLRLRGKVPKADGGAPKAWAVASLPVAPPQPSPAGGGGSSAVPLFLPPLAGEGAEGGWGRAEGVGGGIATGCPHPSPPPQAGEGAVPGRYRRPGTALRPAGRGSACTSCRCRRGRDRC